MSNQWTRKDDALIAERCEGLVVHPGNANWPEGGFAGMKKNPLDYYWVDSNAERSSQ